MHLKQQKYIVDSPVFQYWSSTLKLQLILPMFLRAHRDGPSYFTFNRSTNLRHGFLFLFKQTMSTFGICITLSHVQPEVHSEFQTGNFAIHKSSNVFSGMSIDQAQEQNNNMVKGP